MCILFYREKKYQFSACFTQITQKNPSFCAILSRFMSTDFPMPAEADPDAKRRSEEIRKSAELGQKRAQAEVALRKKIRDEKEVEDARSHASANATAEKAIEAKKKTKGFRAVVKSREKEYEEFEKRKAVEKQWYEKQTAEVREHRKKEKAYMASLNASSTEIIAERRRIEALKAEEVRAEQKIELDHAETVQEALRLERQTIERVTGDARQKTSSAEEKARQELYKIEGWKRAQLTALDAESHRSHASLLSLPPMDASRELQRVTLQFRTKKNAIEKEFSEKRSMIDSGLQREKSVIDREKNETLFQTGLDARRTIAKADRTRDLRLEEMRHEYDRRIRDKSQGIKKK